MAGPVDRATQSSRVVDPQLRKAAQGFEAILLRQMIGAMRSAKLGDDLFGSSATQTYRELSDQQLADSLARNQSLGLAALVEAQFRHKEPDQ